MTTKGYTEALQVDLVNDFFHTLPLLLLLFLSALSFCHMISTYLDILLLPYFCQLLLSFLASLLSAAHYL